MIRTRLSPIKRKTGISEFQLSDNQRDFLLEVFKKFKYPNQGYLNYILEMREVLDNLIFIFDDLLRYSDLSRSGLDDNGILKIRNLPQDPNLMFPPINGGALKTIKRDLNISENTLTFFSLMFGHPYSISCEGRGLVNNLIPKKDQKNDLTGLGSHNELGFHIENTVLKKYATNLNCSPKALLLLGVTQDPNPPFTKLADARNAIDLLSHREVQILSEPHFRFRLPYRWREINDRYSQYITKPIPILKFDNYLDVNGAFYGNMLVKCDNPEAENAAKKFFEALEMVSIKEIIEPGTLVCIDNRVVLHSRTAFDASFNEENKAYRWVQRMFVTEDIDNFANWDKEDDFIFSPNF